jgi:hypothetical protein
MSSVLLFLSLFASPDSPIGGLEIQLVARKAELLAGEPARFAVVWRAPRPIRIMKNEARLFVDRGAGFIEWRELSGSAKSIMEGPQTIAPEQPGYSTQVMSVTSVPNAGSTSDYSLAFPHAGTFRVRLEYGSGPHRISSNAVTLTVVMPSGRDLEFFNRFVVRYPALISALGGQFETLLDPILSDYEQSPYLARPFVLMMERKVARAIGEAPDGLPVQGNVPALLSQLESRDLGDSPFDEDRLVTLARLLGTTGRINQEVEVWRRILVRYPDSESAAYGRWRLRTVTAPLRPSK